MHRPVVDVQVGRVIEFTEDDRDNLYRIAIKLVHAIEQGQPGVARLVLEAYKITRTAILRSHAN